MRSLDAIQGYLKARGNGWSAGESRETAIAVYRAGGLSSPSIKAAMTWSGGSGLAASNYYPRTFRKLTDPWPERTGDLGSLNFEAFWRNSTVQACLAWIQRTFPEARLRVVKGEGDAAEEIKNHPLTQLLTRPNAFYSPARLWQTTLSDWWVHGNGNAYWRKIKDQAGRPVELWPIPACEIEPAWPKDGSAFISHYERNLGGAKESLEIGDVIHFRFSEDPLNRRKGYSPLRAGSPEVGMLNEGASYRGQLLANHGVPSYALTPTDEEAAGAMTPETAAAVERLWVTKFTGRGRGSLFVPNFAANLEKVGYSPQELDIRELLAWDADIICALFGLSSMVLDLPAGEGHRTYANKAEAREAAYESNIVPTHALFADDLERQLLPDFDTDSQLHVSWDYSQVRVLQEDRDKLFARVTSAVGGPWMTPNEARKQQGLEEQPGGDVLYPPKGAAKPSDSADMESAGDAAALAARNTRSFISAKWREVAEQKALNGNGKH